MVDFLFAIIEQFLLALMVQMLYADIGWSWRFSEGVGQFTRKFQVEGDIAHQPLTVSENYKDYPFMWYQNIGSMSRSFVTKNACDGRTDGWNYDPQDHASIATSRGKNAIKTVVL